jgi:ribosomal protein S18 acetylase RimI-like enzyme
MDVSYVNPALNHRPVQDDDLQIICRFPQSERELFFMFPKADYPLTEAQLKAAIDQRYDSTVVLSDGQVAGFANFYFCQPDNSCSIGNVIVTPEVRGKGVGSYLITTMIKIAVTKYRVKDVKLSCFNENVTGLFLYQKLGFVPTFFEERFDKQGKRVASIHMIYDTNALQI